VGVVNDANSHAQRYKKKGHPLRDGPDH
jgi:hypothetical protein